MSLALVVLEKVLMHLNVMPIKLFNELNICSMEKIVKRFFISDNSIVMNKIEHHCYFLN